MKPEAPMPLKGYRERIKAAVSLAEARDLLDRVKRHCPERYVRRCQRVFDQLPFTREET